MIRRSTRRWFPLFMGPMVCAFFIGFVYPFCKGIYLSFCKFKVTSDATFVGLENYRRALKGHSGAPYSATTFCPASRRACCTCGGDSTATSAPKLSKKPYIHGLSG